MILTPSAMHKKQMEYNKNEITDFLKQDRYDSYDRIGNRQFSTTRKKVRFAIMLIITLAILAILSLQWQTFLQSFATTREEQVRKHVKIENVPMWKIVQVTE